MRHDLAYGLRRLAALAAANLALAACGSDGGGGSGGTGTGTGGPSAGSEGGAVSASAGQSSSAFVSTVKQLVASADETSEPLSVEGVGMPAEDNEEPAAAP